MSHKRNVIMFEWLANGLEKQITFFYFICLMKPTNVFSERPRLELRNINYQDIR